MYKVIIREKGKARTLKHRFTSAEAAEKYVIRHTEIKSASIRPDNDKEISKPNLRIAVSRLHRAIH